MQSMIIYYRHTPQHSGECGCKQRTNDSSVQCIQAQDKPAEKTTPCQF